MTPAFKHGFIDEIQKIAALPALAAVVPLALKGAKALASSPTVRSTLADAGTNALGSFMSRSRKPPQGTDTGTGMNPKIGGGVQ